MCLFAYSNHVNYYLNSLDDKKIIVIDAGHGGHDSGALGEHFQEKDLALQMALKLGSALNLSHPDIEVIYTRTTDIFIPLHQRIGKANAVNADLFISIHCNFIKSTRTKGTETYVLGLHRAESNLEVAKRENDVVLLENDFESNYDGFDPNSPIGNIVLSTLQNIYLDQSIGIAAEIEKNFKAQGFSTSRGVKQAGFMVLAKATMPSILVETGFISNREEEQWLASDEGQNSIVESMRSAIGHYFSQIGENNKTVAGSGTLLENPKINTYNKSSQSIKKESKKTVKSQNNADKYVVQIAAMKYEVSEYSNDEIEQIGKLNVKFENGYYKYQLEGFETMEQAKAARKKIQDLGYSSAFIIEK
jgi:N-acetylmuramoyl-L-alanine amidase